MQFEQLRQLSLASPPGKVWVVGDGFEAVHAEVLAVRDDPLGRVFVRDNHGRAITLEAWECYSDRAGALHWALEQTRNVRRNGSDRIVVLMNEIQDWRCRVATAERRGPQIEDELRRLEAAEAEVAPELGNPIA